MDLHGKVVLITGGSRGIGREIAFEAAAAGARVGIVYRSASADAESLESEIRSRGGELAIAQADIGDPVAAESAVASIEDALGSIDVLVNNAGIAQDNLLATMSDEEIAAVIGINLLGTMYVTRAVVRRMIPRRSGRILNMSSVAARLPGRGQSNYAASKGGVEAFTRALAVELAPRGILVNALAPGVVETEMSATVRQYGEEEILKRLLVKRYASSGEIARAALWLIAQDYMTGEIVSLNGGMKRD